MEKYAELSFYEKKSQIVQWFFEILREFDDKMKAKFLFYVFGKIFFLNIFKLSTFLGCFRVPIGGFRLHPINIDRLEDANSLPTVHTCFGKIDLPPYTSKEVFSEKLILAINEGGESGFLIA